MPAGRRRFFLRMHDTREHTNSYYAATRERIEFPVLRGEQRADIVIVGGGFTGVSAALYLQERGYKVALLEANRIGWGASGRNGGQLIDGFVNEDKIEKRFGSDAGEMAYRMGLESREIVVERVERYAIDCNLKFGFLDLALKQSDVDDFEAQVAQKRRKNYPHTVELIEKSRMPEFVGSDKYVGGLVNAGNGHLHPLNLCIGEVRAAAQQGAQVFEQSRVTKIRHGAKPRVDTSIGSIRADKIILAGNAYLGDAEPRLRSSIIPAGSYIIATEALPRELANELLPKDSACCDQRVALDYFRLSADNRLLFGGLCNYSGRKPKDISAVLQPKMISVFPQLEDVRIDYEWGGYIAISINRIPQFGRIEGNTYFAQGYSGHGVAPTHLAGKMLADVVCGDSEQFDVFARVRHLKLPGGRWFANPALALGMMYYRIREVL